MIDLINTVLAVNAMYPTYQGEVNAKGIGFPVIFLRLQGCHIRCYEATLGTLCDTPEALQKDDSMGKTLPDIIHDLNAIRLKTGISYICLSGGDPLWRKPDDVRSLLYALTAAGYEVSVETSGTLSIAPYKDITDVTWVLDYKLCSAGVKLPFSYKDLPLLYEKDFIKFVVYDEADYQQMCQIVPELLQSTRASLAVGAYWGGKMTTSGLVNRMLNDGLMSKVTLNVQLHKMVTYCDFNQEQLTKINIPPLI